jgi:hypothetical protein
MRSLAGNLSTEGRDTMPGRAALRSDLLYVTWIDPAPRAGGSRTEERATEDACVPLQHRVGLYNIRV